MTYAIVQFPGSTGDRELFDALKNVVKVDVEFVNSKETSLDGYEAIFLPGGFSYGDYLRPGAIAKLDPIVAAIKEAADKGILVVGLGNGFQILTEIGLLPGGFVQNQGLAFINADQEIKVENNETAVSAKYDQGQVLNLSIAHEFGNYYVSEAGLAGLKANNQIIFTYAGKNPNGSTEAIAGVANQAGNVFGLMARPERATEEVIGGTDGLAFFESIVDSVNSKEEA